jgi:glucosylceramidase
MNSPRPILRLPWTAACILAVAPALGGPGSWSVFETAKDNGHRLSPVAAPTADTAPAPDAIIYDAAQQLQVMEGFGGALTDSSAFVLDQLSADRRAGVLRMYYDPKEGIGYTLARTHINSCDFSLGSWSLDPVPGDTALEHFSLAPMRAWALPLIHEVQAIAGAANFHLLASPWSPPSWMKTNGRMTYGGSLKPEYRQAWADYMVRFVTEMQSNEHIPVWALTMQNEPAATQTWESCIYTPAEERDFVRDHLGPALEKAGVSSVHLCILDHNRDLMDKWTNTIYSDPEAAKYDWGTAIHWYVSEDYAAPSRAHAAFPSKATLFTEGCNDRGEAKGKFELGMWEHGERYANSMVNDFRNWVCGWIDWNIVLDQTGGPNHVGNFCDAPVIVDTETGDIRYTPAFYYIGQFSKFVHPGARRIESHGGPAALQSVAFRNPDGGVAVVVLNTRASAVAFHLAGTGGSFSCSIPARAIQTYIAGP